MDAALAPELARLAASPVASTERSRWRRTVGLRAALVYAAALTMSLLWGWHKHEQAAEAEARARSLDAELARQRAGVPAAGFEVIERLPDLAPTAPGVVLQTRPVRHTPDRGSF